MALKLLTPLDIWTKERASYLEGLKNFFKDGQTYTVIDLMPSPKQLALSAQMAHYELGQFAHALSGPDKINALDELCSPYHHDCPCSPLLLYYDENENMIWLHQATH